MSKRCYLVTVPVTAVVGHQYFTVIANSEADAIKKWRNHEAEFDSEELEVQGINESGVFAELMGSDSEQNTGAQS